MHFIDGDPLDWSALEVQAPPPVATAPTFDAIKEQIAALPPKADTPDPTPVLAMIAKLDNATHRETLLQSIN